MTDITADLVRTLVARQFPQWADLSVTPVEPGGWDNRTFRLGDRLSVRLPSAERYVAQVAKEQEWLPRLTPHLPVAAPRLRGQGMPDEGYPWPWSILTWLEGEVARPDQIVDRPRFAADLGRFLRALQAIDTAGGPMAGVHNFHRGGSLGIYASETEAALSRIADGARRERLIEIWDAARASEWNRPPVWVHGDVAAGNLLLRRGRLAAVIDFGNIGVGDPACDLAIAWTFLDADGRRQFRDTLQVDEQSWARGRGWALWKAVITIDPEHEAYRPAEHKAAERALSHIIADFLLSAGDEQ